VESAVWGGRAVVGRRGAGRWKHGMVWKKGEAARQRALRRRSWCYAPVTQREVVAGGTARPAPGAVGGVVGRVGCGVQTGNTGRDSEMVVGVPESTAHQV